MPDTLTYRQRSRQFLAKARQELASGDLEQASKKGWGAASLIVKAAADQHNLDHQVHGDLFRVVAALIRQTGDSELRRLFHTANGLHGNFYENWLDAEGVAEGINDVERFVDKVEQLL